MAENFDPYFKWLGIPAREQPPNHYRLLGLPAYEGDPEVIQNAADQRMAHLRTMQVGPRATLAEQLLNEVASASHCLLNPTQKAIFDSRLIAADRERTATPSVRESGASTPPEPPPVPPPVPARVGLPQFACPHCGLEMENDGSLAGTTVACPACRLVFVVPATPTTPHVGSLPTYQVVTQTSAPPPIGDVQPAPRTLYKHGSSRRRPPSGPNIFTVVLGGIAGIGIALAIILNLDRILPRANPPAPGLERKPGVQRSDGTANRQRHEKPDFASTPATTRPPLADPQPAVDTAGDVRPSAPSTAPTPLVDPPIANSPPDRSGKDLVSFEFWRLPNFLSTDETTVMSLTESPNETLGVSIETSAAENPTSAAFFAESAANGQSWIIRYAEDVANESSITEVGSLRRDGADWRFAWADSTAEAIVIRRQLQNCQIVIQHGESSRVFQLREPLGTDSLIVDLKTSPQIVEFPVSDLPRTDSIRLRMRLDGFAGGAAFRNGIDTLRIGGSTTVEFAEYPGAEITVRFDYLHANSKFVLRLESIYHLNKVRQFDFTLSQLEEREKALNKSLVADRAELEQVRKKMKRLKQILGRREKSLRQSIGIDIPRQLEIIAKLRPLIAALSGRASIRYAIVAEGLNGHEVVLVVGKKPAD
ncbi:MAG TPA: hypothetical protein VMP01_04215 [Pirellulaceae bacterium]|nr:hypothetical protein [Pirellulaceae bacterium]